MDILAVWLSLLTAFTLWVAASDFRFRRIRNHGLLIALLIQSLWLLMTAAGGLSAHDLIPGWRQALAGFGLGLVMFYPLWRWNAMGAADVKLIATLGFLLGIKGVLPILLMASVAAGVHGLVIVGQGGWSLARAQWRQGTGSRRGVPYGAYLALSTLVWVMLRAYE